MKEIENFLISIDFPRAIIKDLYFFSLPEDKIQVYRNHYGIIKGEFIYHSIPFGVNDFILAYIAAENNYGVVSFDHHLQYTIQKYLDYECFFPKDVKELFGDSMLFLDTNILLEFQRSDQKKQREILSMIKNNPSITFLVSENIISEFTNVYFRDFADDRPNSPHHARNIKSSKIQAKSLSLETIDEDHLKLFIEDFEKFESRKKIRKRERLQTEVLLESHGHKGEKWTVSPRFRTTYLRDLQ